MLNPRNIITCGLSRYHHILPPKLSLLTADGLIQPHLSKYLEVEPVTIQISSFC